MDYIVIIAVRSGYSSARPDSYDNNIIHTETYTTPVPDLTAMITIESILRRTILQCQTSIVFLSMDYIVIAVRSSTGVLYVSVWILLLS
jgi:hypothetical protein